MPAAVQVVIDYVIRWSARFKGGFSYVMIYSVTCNHCMIISVNLVLV